MISYRPLQNFLLLFPLHVPAGSRISARAQNLAPSGTYTVDVAVTLFPPTEFSSSAFGRAVLAYGAATADSGGTSFDPGSSANTKGSYTQLTAATTHPINWFYQGLGDQANASRTDCTFLIDIAIGAAASEKIIVPDLLVSCPAAWDGPLPTYLGPFPRHIPAGSRIAVRAHCSITDATDRTLDAVLYGI